MSAVKAPEPPALELRIVVLRTMCGCGCVIGREAKATLPTYINRPLIGHFVRERTFVKSEDNGVAQFYDEQLEKL